MHIRVAENEWESLAKVLLERVSRNSTTHGGATLVLLSGDVGAGKTTFVQTIARMLGVVQTLQSPTFVIMKQYPLVESIYSKLIHVDAYRLSKLSELEVLGFSALVENPENLILLEWPECVLGIEFYPHISVRIEHAEEGREVTLG